MSYTYDPTAYRAVFEQHFTFLAGFWRNVHRFADELALHDTARDRSFTYAQLGAEVNRLAAGLAARGVAPGDVLGAIGDRFCIYDGSSLSTLNGLQPWTVIQPGEVLKLQPGPGGS